MQGKGPKKSSFGKPWYSDWGFVSAALRVLIPKFIGALIVFLLLLAPIAFPGDFIAYILCAITLAFLWLKFKTGRRSFSHFHSCPEKDCQRVWVCDDYGCESPGESMCPTCKKEIYRPMPD